MALNLNDLKITPRDGLYVYMPNAPQPHNCIAAEALQAGDVLTLDTTSTNPNCPVVKKAAVTDPVYGIVPYDAMKNSYEANDKVMAAVEGSYIYKVAAGAVTPGATLYFDADMQVTATETEGNSTLGTANTYAAAAGDFVQVKLKFA